MMMEACSAALKEDVLKNSLPYLPLAQAILSGRATTLQGGRENSNDRCLECKKYGPGCQMKSPLE
jgi:hypothetical protein